MLNLTYTDMTQSCEEMIRSLFANSEAIPAGEIKMRAGLARAVLCAWSSHAQSLVLPETHTSEYDRLEELVHELPLSARVTE